MQDPEPITKEHAQENARMDNNRRANRIQTILTPYMELRGLLEEEANIKQVVQDLISDALHFANLAKFDSAEILADATLNFNEEMEEAGNE